VPSVSLTLQVSTPKGFVVERTAKYFFALLQQIWIVSVDWVEASYEVGHWVEEAAFEIYGDKKGARGAARKSRTSSGEKLLSGLIFYISQPVLSHAKWDRKSFDLLLELGGARSLNRKAFETAIGRDTDNETLNTFIHITATARKEKNIVGATCVTMDWLLDSISHYQRFAFKDYLVER
jgi:hypothetical protein